MGGNLSRRNWYLAARAAFKTGPARSAGCCLSWANDPRRTSRRESSRRHWAQRRGRAGLNRLRPGSRHGCGLAPGTTAPTVTHPRRYPTVGILVIAIGGTRSRRRRNSVQGFA